MTLRNSSMPNDRPLRSSSAITASFKVCMCTVGVSLYSSTASQPRSLFTSTSLPGRLYNLLLSDHRLVSTNFVEEQADCHGHRPGAGAVGHVEGMPGTRQLDVADEGPRHRPQLLDEVACLLHGDDRVATAVDDEEWWRIGVRARNGRGITEDLGMPGDAPLDHDALQEVDEAGPLGRGAILPVVAAVDPDDRVDGGVGTLGEVALHFGIIPRQAGQCREVTACRRAGQRDEVAVAAELVHVGARPGDGRL